MENTQEIRPNESNEMKVSEEYEAALKVVENQKLGRIPILWDTKGEYLHDCGFRYRVASGNDVEGVANWTTRETLKIDAQKAANADRRWTLKSNPNIKE
jgi:hypothetical protein